MLFNSLDFAIFLPIVFLLYWFVVQKNLKFQNTLIVFASNFERCDFKDPNHFNYYGRNKFSCDLFDLLREKKLIRLK